MGQFLRALAVFVNAVIVVACVACTPAAPCAEKVGANPANQVGWQSTNFMANGAVTNTVTTQPTYVRSAYAVNRNAAIRYLQLINSGSDAGATDGGAPTLQFEIPASGVVEIGTDYFSANGLTFPSGLSYGVSTTSNSYVAATASDHDVMLTYVQ